MNELLHQVTEHSSARCVVECEAKPCPGQLPSPVDGDTAVLYWSRHEQLLLMFGIESPDTIQVATTHLWINIAC